MSLPRNKQREVELPTGTCWACGRCMAATELKRPSIPPLISLAAATDFEPTDTEPPLVYVDRNWYCPPCRFRVNLRRGILAIALVVFMFMLASLAALLFRG